MNTKNERQYAKALTILNDFIRGHNGLEGALKSINRKIGHDEYPNDVSFFGEDKIEYGHGRFEIALKENNDTIYFQGDADSIGFFKGRYFCIFDDNNPEFLIDLDQFYADYDFSGLLKIIVPNE